MRFLKNIFNRKKYGATLPVTLSTTYGEYCPNCKKIGSLNYFHSFYEASYESFYYCKKCKKKYNSKEYAHLIKKEIRKQKLKKLNSL